MTNNFDFTEYLDEPETSFTTKIGGTYYEVSTHFSPDGKQSVLQQFMELLSTTEISHNNTVEIIH